MHAKLYQNVLQMCPYGVQRQHAFGGDTPVGVAAGDHCQDLPLAAGQPADTHVEMVPRARMPGGSRVAMHDSRWSLTSITENCPIPASFTYPPYHLIPHDGNGRRAARLLRRSDEILLHLRESEPDMRLDTVHTIGPEGQQGSAFVRDLRHL